MPAMPAERLKVRCYRCNQLLAVAPSKAGTVVACPKCKADLMIPRAELEPSNEQAADPSAVGLTSATFKALTPVTEAATAGGGGSASTSFLDEIAAVIPPEVAALRPEDLRVEAEFFETLTREPATPPRAADPFPFPGPLSANDLLPPPAVAEAIVTAPAGVASEVASGAGGAVEMPPPLPASVPVTVPEANIVVPPISIEPAAIRPRADAESRAIRDVVLPASVVLAWSLFVLAAIPMAFVAGLMIGHFIWKSGP
jgi:hypothetical protein